MRPSRGLVLIFFVGSFGPTASAATLNVLEYSGNPPRPGILLNWEQTAEWIWKDGILSLEATLEVPEDPVLEVKARRSEARIRGKAIVLMMSTRGDIVQIKRKSGTYS